MSMMNAPISMANIEPRGPARFRKVVPGMTKAPQPTQQPKDMAQMASGEKHFLGDELAFSMPFVSLVGGIGNGFNNATRQSAS